MLLYDQEVLALCAYFLFTYYEGLFSNINKVYIDISWLQSLIKNSHGYKDFTD